MDLYYDTKNAPYKGIFVLLINWIDDDLGTITELEELERTCQESFHCETEIYRIPSRSSYDSLQEKLFSVKKEHGQEGHLLIVYYGGHGKDDASKRSVWQAYKNGRRGRPKSPTVAWYDLQSIPKRAPCDFLLLLDCCYAGSAARGDSEGRFEVLAACGAAEQAAPVTKYSFTRNLIQKITSFNHQPFTVEQLYQRLLRDRKRMLSTPVYRALGEAGSITFDSHPQSLGLLQPPSSSLRTPSLISDTSSNDGDDMNPPDSPLQRPIYQDEPRVGIFAAEV